MAVLWRRLLGNHDGPKVISAYRVALSRYSCSRGFCPHLHVKMRDSVLGHIFVGYFVLGDFVLGDFVRNSICCLFPNFDVSYDLHVQKLNIFTFS